MKEFLAYVEDTTDRFAARAKSPLIRQIHRKVVEVKHNPKMEVEYMTLMQRDRENIELGRKKAFRKANRPELKSHSTLYGFIRAEKRQRKLPVSLAWRRIMSGRSWRIMKIHRNEYHRFSSFSLICR